MSEGKYTVRIVDYSVSAQADSLNDARAMFKELCKVVPYGQQFTIKVYDNQQDMIVLTVHCERNQLTYGYKRLNECRVQRTPGMGYAKKVCI